MPSIRPASRPARPALGVVVVVVVIVVVGEDLQNKEEQRDLPVREERGHGRILICEDLQNKESEAKITPVDSSDDTSDQLVDTSDGGRTPCLIVCAGRPASNQGLCIGRLLEEKSSRSEFITSDS
jgi:hypothetical protein